jgi:hypothetical protein
MKNTKYYTVSEGLFVTPYEQICHLYHGTNKLLFYKNDHEVCFIVGQQAELYTAILVFNSQKQHIDTLDTLS